MTCQANMEALFAHPSFRLLYVPASNTVPMTVIRPANHPCIQRRLRRGPAPRPRAQVHGREHVGFYAVSHLWGEDADLWDVGDMIRDEETGGRPVDPIPMRAKKRTTLVALLRSHPDSFWWIDVLCARAGTPLGMMRDIYAGCTTCYAMIDAIDDLDHDFWPCPSDLERLRAAAAAAAPAAETDDDPVKTLNHLFDDWPLEWMLFTELAKGHWWDRVWTLQELVLPRVVELMSETGHAQGRLPFACLRSILGNVLHIARQCDDTAFDAVCIPRTSARFCTIWLDCIDGVTSSAAALIHEPLPPDARLFNVIENTLGKCTRICTKPVDYVYGILGLLPHYNVPPAMTDPNAVWKHFILEMEKDVDRMHKQRSPPKDHHHRHHCLRYPGLKVRNGAENFDLARATCLADVYRGILEVTSSTGTKKKPTFLRSVQSLFSSI